MILAIWNFIWTASLYGSIVGLILLLLKRILKNNLNGKWTYLLWLILIVKLTVPYGLESKLSLFNKVPIDTISLSTTQLSLSNFTDDTTLTTIPSDKNFTNSITNNTISPTVTKENVVTNSLTNLISKNIIPYIWFSGFIVMLLWMSATYTSFYIRITKKQSNSNALYISILSEIKKQLNIKITITLIQQDLISTPSLFGVFFIKILLPYNLNLSSQEIKYIFTHELTHYKRKDHLMNLLLSLLQAIYWFNPLIWYLFKEIRSDIEIATDEASINILGNDNLKNYGFSLLSMINTTTSNKLLPRVLGIGNNKKNIERRIKMINKKSFFDKKKRLISTIGVLCIIILSVSLLTNGYKNNFVSAKYESDLKVLPEDGLPLIKSNFYGYEYMYYRTFLGENGNTYYNYSFDHRSDNIGPNLGLWGLIDAKTGDVLRYDMFSDAIYSFDNTLITTVSKTIHVEYNPTVLTQIEETMASKINVNLNELLKNRQKQANADLLIGGWEIFLTDLALDKNPIKYFNSHYEIGFVTIPNYVVGNWIDDAKKTSLYQFKFQFDINNDSILEDVIFIMDKNKQNATIYIFDTTSNSYIKYANAFFSVLSNRNGIN